MAQAAVSPFHIIPIAFLFPTGILCATGGVIISRAWACRFVLGWDADGQHTSVRALEGLERCLRSDIDARTSQLTSAMVAVYCIGAMLAIPAISRLMGRFGRKPALVVCSLFNILYLLAFASSYLVTGWFGVALLAVGILAQPIGSQLSVELILRAIVLDTADVETRTVWFSILSGTLMGCMALQGPLGGFLGTQLGVVAPYYLAVVLNILGLGYVVVFLPESLQGAPLANAGARSPARTETQSLKSRLILPLKPLLPSTHAPLPSGARNWIPLACSLLSAIMRIAGSFIGTLLLLKVTSGRLGWSQAQAGVLVGYLTGLRGVVLLGIVPAATHFLKRDGGSTDIPVAEVATRADLETVPLLQPLRPSAPARRSRSAIKLAGIGLLFVSLECLLLGCGKDAAELYIGASMGGPGALASPNMLSHLVNSVEKPQLDSTLAAFTQLETLGTTLSSIVLGSIAASSAKSFPDLPFYVGGGLIMCTAFGTIFVQ